jgi:hypothetical protein
VLIYGIETAGNRVGINPGGPAVRYRNIIVPVETRTEKATYVAEQNSPRHPSHLSDATTSLQARLSVASIPSVKRA